MEWIKFTNIQHEVDHKKWSTFKQYEAWIRLDQIIIHFGDVGLRCWSIL
jgi:hypothetical protein